MPVTDKLLKETLKSLLGSNHRAFDILSVCLKKPEHYDVAIEAFK